MVRGLIRRIRNVDEAAANRGSRVQRMHGEAKVDGQLAADAEIMSIVAPREEKK